MVADTLRSPGTNSREVREIVLQNLIASTHYDDDVSKRHAPSQGVLEELRSIIEEAADEPGLISPLGLAVDYLLNVDVILGARADSHELPIRSAITSVRGILKDVAESRAPHFVHASRLIRAHRECFVASSQHAPSLPPQRSEALMAWEQLTNMRPYLIEQGLIHLRSNYEVFLVMIGKRPASSIMNQRQATIAFPKTIAQVRYRRLDRLVSSVSNDPNLDPEFRKYLLDEIPTPEESELAGCVLFSQYAVRTRSRELSRRGLLSKEAATNVAAGAFARIAAAQSIEWLWGKCARKDTEAAALTQLPSGVQEAVIASAAAAERDDAESGSKADRLEEEIGQLDLDL